jgi:hypothetical protein
MALVHEPHYEPAQLAELWGVSPETIRRLFADEPGVLKIGQSSRRVGKKLTRGYWSYRIPHSVAGRVHERLAARR